MNKEKIYYYGIVVWIFAIFSLFILEIFYFPNPRPVGSLDYCGWRAI